MADNTQSQNTSDSSSGATSGGSGATSGTTSSATLSTSSDTPPITTPPITTPPITTPPITTPPITTPPIATPSITIPPITTQSITTQPITTQPITTLPPNTSKDIKTLAKEAISIMKPEETDVYLIENTYVRGYSGSFNSSKNTVFAFIDNVSVQAIEINITDAGAEYTEKERGSSQRDLSKILRYLDNSSKRDLIYVNPIRPLDTRITFKPSSSPNNLISGSITNTSATSLDTLMTPEGGNLYIIIPKGTPSTNILLTRGSIIAKYCPPQLECPACPSSSSSGDLTINSPTSIYIMIGLVLLAFIITFILIGILFSKIKSDE